MNMSDMVPIDLNQPWTFIFHRPKSFVNTEVCPDFLAIKILQPNKSALLPALDQGLHIYRIHCTVSIQVVIMPKTAALIGTLKPLIYEKFTPSTRVLSLNRCS